MLKIPPTGIDVSQGELQAQLQHLDFCTSLLKQGFKKHEIARYFRDRNADSKESPDHGTSTYDLLSRVEDAEESYSSTSLTSQSSQDQTDAQFASPIRSPGQLSTYPEPPTYPHSADLTTDIVVGKKMHVPRQSSLLRFARAVSPEASQSGKIVAGHFSPRSNITYRPRSETYSYDQSEMDEEDLIQRCTTPTEKLEQLSLEDDLLFNTNSSNTTVHITSNLRPDAQPFTPFFVRQSQAEELLGSPDPISPVASDLASFPSSPPEILPPQDDDQASSSLLPSMSHTPSGVTSRTPPTLRTRSRQQYLDGSFTVYNDSVPASAQPQTPAELDRSHFLNQFNAAYTAPPGMIRSSPTRQGTSDHRQASGELSPTAQASMIRARRQREFQRGLRIEGLRIDRARTDARHPGTVPGDGVDPLNIWRDDLDADGVGEENFDDATTATMLRGMRAISGNRRSR